MRPRVLLAESKEPAVIGSPNQIAVVRAGVEGRPGRFVDRAGEDADGSADAIAPAACGQKNRRRRGEPHGFGLGGSEESIALPMSDDDGQWPRLRPACST
jgi:hypothetical protein